MLATNMTESKLAPFTNVERLVTGSFEIISSSTLRSLKNLKELHYRMAIEDAFDYFSDEVLKLDRMKLYASS